jgi:hypothetical protein
MKRSTQGCYKRIMKKIERVMQKYSKEGIMVNQNLRKLLKINLQEDHSCSIHKEASIMIMIGQGRNSEGLHHKQYHSLPGMQICIMVIVFIVLILDIRLQIAGIIKEMFKQEVHMWPHVTLNVTNVITMDT